MQNPTVIALLLASVSAAGTTLRDTEDPSNWKNNFPEYSDWTILATAATSAELDAHTETGPAAPGGAITPKGGYSCIRSSHNYMFPQTRTGDALGAAITEVAAGVALTKTFYTHTPEVAATSLTGTIALFNSLCYQNSITIQSAPNTKEPSLIATNKGKNTDVTPGVNDFVDNIHPDFVLISTWQATTRCTGTQSTALDGTTVTVAGTTLGKDYKCTYKFTVADTKGAPGFKLKESNFASFNFHWIEFQTDAMTNIVPAASVTPLFMGTYVGAWPHPIKYQIITTNIGLANLAKITDQPNDMMLNAYGDGMPGFLLAKPDSDSIWKGTASSTVSHPELTTMTNNYNTKVAAYNTAVTAFNLLAANYNTQQRAEKARLADSTKAAFDPPVAIPQRPCPPMAPAAFDGPEMILDNTTSLTAAQNTAGAVTWWEGSPDKAWSVKQGYLQAGSSSTASSGNVNAGHVFGILGQQTTWPAEWSVSTTEAAFQWKAPSGSHEVIVSVLPYAQAQANDKSFSIDAINVQFKSDWSIAQTAVTSTPVSALEPMGAMALGATVAAVVAVQASLF